ncbi:MAG TPA: DUF1801 domain-containing protein [Flavisolibacter sp.]|nr:DUF1801 domain-containing protein [Flavisolibacter sp.]
MNTKGKSVPKDHEAYIAGFPPDIRKILEAVRATVREAAPGAEETIKYGMPSFYLKGNLVYFAAFKKHIGFYPAPTGNPVFEKDFAAYKTGRGSIQFPLDRPMPLELITRIVKFWVEERGKKK